MIDFQVGKQIDQLIKRLHLRDFSSADVNEDPPCFEVRDILDLKSGNLISVMEEDLPKRDDRIVKSGSLTGREIDSVVTNVQTISLIGHQRVAEYVDWLGYPKRGTVSCQC